MVTFRPDTSFPYLAFALMHRLDYGQVLRFVDWLEAKRLDDRAVPPVGVDIPIPELVTLSCIASDEQDRRAAVTRPS
jgi:hypothetical protein